MAQEIWSQSYNDTSKTRVLVDDGDVVIRHRTHEGESMTIFFPPEEFEAMMAAYIRNKEAINQRQA